MKKIFLLCCIISSSTTQAQQAFPDFLAGVWKQEEKESYEQWTRMNENWMKGVSYTMMGETPMITEYMEVFKKAGKLYYSASLPTQNKGEPVLFTQTRSDSIFVYENTKHDFPNFIEYHKSGDSRVRVSVTGKDGKGFTFRMQKQSPIAKAASQVKNQNPNYDSALAEKLGADDYGMKSYWLVILKTGTNDTTDKAFIAEQFNGHMNNINKLVAENKLVVAGPMGKNELNYRGIFILTDIDTEAEAKHLLQTDPAIQSGLLGFELLKWYGSAAIPEYLPASDKIWKLQP